MGLGVPDKLGVSTFLQVELHFRTGDLAEA